MTSLLQVRTGVRVSLNWLKILDDSWLKASTKINSIRAMLHPN